MWLFKYYPNGVVESVIKASVVLSTEMARAQGGRFTSYSAIANYLLKRDPTDHNIAVVETNIHKFKQVRLKATHYDQQL